LIEPNQSVSVALKKLNLMPQNGTYSCKPKEYCSTTNTTTTTATNNNNNNNPICKAPEFYGHYMG